MSYLHPIWHMFIGNNNTDIDLIFDIFFHKFLIIFFSLDPPKFTNGNVRK